LAIIGSITTTREDWMKKRFFILPGIILIVLTACGLGIPDDQRIYPMIADQHDTDAGKIYNSTLTRIKAKVVYFEHASVGSNVTDGLTDLATSDSRYAVDRLGIGEDNDSLSAAPGAWIASHNGFIDNARGNPGLLAKVSRFQSRMTAGNFASTVDVAMFKFCFIDTDGTATDAFNAVKSAMTALQAAYPSTVFVWWTMPIMTAGDPRRDEYNTLVRDYCIANDQYLLDIAAIECHDPSGALQTDANGRVMFSGYSSDGGHLNQAGALRVANAFWCLLAKICE
jgi:hypothetical protein